MSSTTLFSKTPPLKLFFLASLPGAVSMLASALYQTLDGVFVGQFVGATAFAALRCPDPTEACMTMMRGLGASAPSSTPGSTDSGCPSGDVGESSLLRGEPPSGADEMPSESARALCGCCGKADASISISGIIP